MKRIAAALLLILLAGCATTAKYEKVLNTWVGSSEKDLVRKWGPPQGVYESDGTRYLTYNSSRNLFMPGVAPTYTTQYVGNTAFTSASGGMPAQNIAMSCQTTFELTNGLITSWRWQGNDCTAQ